MRKYYILSGMDAKNEYNFYDDLAEILKKELCNFDSIVYISAYPNDYEKNKKLAKSEKFLKIGIEFKTSIVLDYSYTIEETKKVILENNLIFLYGGNPYEQMKFILDYDIGDMLKEKTLITLSAGSINISNDAICTKDEDFDVTSKYKRIRFYRL